ncbi:tyrosinase family protein [Nostoc sp. FACHB-110]|uniref:tyrosinase family protein n=1 Tax=Nostoc sp. FACHB-110 TaxID=2692834 RepID=UPI00168699BD|nr:tyrosinase family protein [Nostoc sp. FACHB-110]MBD2439301.1 tyrosinase family protein [Nostoc sp. FACHB-110]
MNLFKRLPISGVFLSRNLLKNLLKFLGPILMCTILAFGMVITPAEASTIYVRKNAHSPEAKKDLESLKIAFEKMRAMDCTNPLSWYYQGAIHWLPTKPEEIVGLTSNPLCSSYTQSNPGFQIAWNNCTHIENSTTSGRNFLVWHRFYLYHFENIVRVLSGNKDFALPYWRYISLDSLPSKTVPENKIFLTMPKAFIEPAILYKKDQNEQFVGNSLYEDGRSERLLNGEEIDQKFLEMQLYKGVEDLRNKREFVDFNTLIELNPHIIMHPYIGGLDFQTPDIRFYPPKNGFNKIYNSQKNTGLVTEIPSAGFDPIFWLHHGNIDRLWAQWTTEEGKLVTLADLQADNENHWQYKFFDAVVKHDGTIESKEVTYTLEKVIEKVYDLGYKYDDTPIVNDDTPIVKLSSEQPSISAKKFASREINKVVDSEHPLKVEVNLTSQKLTEFRLLDQINPNSPDFNGYTLKIDVTYTGRPYSTYDVYLDLPNDESKSDINTFFVGTIAFLVSPTAEPVTKNFEFDITDELIQQARKRILERNSKNVSLLIQKASGDDNESLNVERIALYEK